MLKVTKFHELAQQKPAPAMLTRLMFIAYASRQGPDKPVQMRGLSRAFTACIQSMEVDVEGAVSSEPSLLANKMLDFLKLRS